MYRAWTLAALLLVPTVAAGQDPPPRPVQELFLTEVVYPQEKREIQVTVGSMVDRSRPGLSGLMTASIEYGLTDRWQLQAGWDGYSRFRGTPLRDLRTARVSVGTKYSFMNMAGSRIHAALGVDVEFPHVDAFPEGEGEDAMEIEPFIALAADVSGGITIFGTAGASLEPREVADLARRGERPDDRGTLSVGVLRAFRRVTLAMEFAPHSDGLPWRLDGGPLMIPSIVMRPGGEWELSAGAPFALHRGQRAIGFAMNIVKEF